MVPAGGRSISFLHFSIQSALRNAVNPDHVTYIVSERVSCILVDEAGASHSRLHPGRHLQPPPLGYLHMAILRSHGPGGFFCQNFIMRARLLWKSKIRSGWGCSVRPPFQSSAQTVLWHSASVLTSGLWRRAAEVTRELEDG